MFVTVVIDFEGF